jgi:hypothetical protein
MTASSESIPLKSIHDPEHWRAKAIDARSVAAATTNPNIRQKFIVAADSFERMAALLEHEPKSARAQEMRTDDA